MTALVERVAREGGTTRADLRHATAKPRIGRPKHFTFKYHPQNRAFDLRLSFSKGRVERHEIIAALEAILTELRRA